MEYDKTYLNINFEEDEWKIRKKFTGTIWLEIPPSPPPLPGWKTGGSVYLVNFQERVNVNLDPKILNYCELLYLFSFKFKIVEYILHTKRERHVRY